MKTKSKEATKLQVEIMMEITLMLEAIRTNNTAGAISHNGNYIMMLDRLTSLTKD